MQMEIKGTVVKSIKDYVEQLHSSKFNEWMSNLPEESKNIFSNSIYATSWYPVEPAAIIPTEVLGKLIFKSVEKGAIESGRYSAETGLNGIYKVFIRILTPSYLIQRASKILPTFYRPSNIEIIELNSKSAILQISEFGKPHEVLEKRIEGWIMKALEITKCKNLKIDAPQSMTKGDPVTELKISWD